jgi:membrane protein implicated in regulation of membrane protease activity
MTGPERLYRNSIRVFSLLFVLLGVAILVSTIAQGGGPLSLGVFLGIAFLAVGLVRGWLGRQDRGHAPS